MRKCELKYLSYKEMLSTKQRKLFTYNIEDFTNTFRRHYALGDNVKKNAKPKLEAKKWL